MVYVLISISRLQMKLSLKCRAKGLKSKATCTLNFILKSFEQFPDMNTKVNLKQDTEFVYRSVFSHTPYPHNPSKQYMSNCYGSISLLLSVIVIIKQYIVISSYSWCQVQLVHTQVITQIVLSQHLVIKWLISDNIMPLQDFIVNIYHKFYAYINSLAMHRF